MGEVEGWGWAQSPSGSPMYITKDDHWTHFDNSVNAVSFGFVATAILISMFLVMAIFERFLRPNSPAFSPSGGRNLSDIESQMSFNGKLGGQTPKIFYSITLCASCFRYCPLLSSGVNLGDIESQMSFNGKLGDQTSKVSMKAREVSVLMPGEDVPTFLANPAPVPCPPERDPWPLHQQNSLPGFLNSDSNPQS